MLRRTTIEDFTQLKDIAEDRLHPENIRVFLIAALVFSLIMTMVFVLAIKSRGNELHSDWSIAANVAIVIFLLQLAVTLFFISLDNLYKFQRLLSVVITLISFKMSIDPYQLYFVGTGVVAKQQHMTKLGIYIFVIGLAFLMVCTIRALIRVRSGCFRTNGKMFYDYNEVRTKIFVSIPFILAAIMMVGTLIMHPISLFSDLTGIYGMLLFFLALQYIMATAMPDFILHTYCKFRFPEFYIQPESQVKTRLSNSINQSIIYWSKRPLGVLKSQSGWKTVEKAPKWTMLVVGLELFIIPFLLFVFLAIYGVLRGKMEITEISEFLINSAILISVIVILLLIVLRIGLWIVGKLLRK